MTSLHQSRPAQSSLTGPAMLQVAAYTSGRDTVTLDDCLLLQHILWQRPEEASRISDWLLSQMAEDNGLEAANYILRGDIVVCLLGGLHDH